MQNRRQNNRSSANLPVVITIGTQVVIQGQLKDISLKSAFIQMKSSVYLQLNDELAFVIKCSAADDGKAISGSARISRILAGEGIAIYFVSIDTESQIVLEEIVKISTGGVRYPYP